MKRANLVPTKPGPRSLAVCAGLCLLGGGAAQTHAQFTSAQKNQLRDVVGARAEAGVILGSGDSASGGTYTFDRTGKDAEADLYKLSGRGEIGAPRALGGSDVKWNPVVYGGLGHLSAENTINRTDLAGNKVESSITSVQLGGGAAFHFTERFSVSPTVGLIYGHGEYEFQARTAAGRALGNLDTDFDSLGVVPGLGVSYKLPLGKARLEFSSRYAYYGTGEIGDSDVLEVGGNSHEWENKIDADVPLGVSLWDCPLHTGGYVSRTEMFGDIEDGLRADHFYSFNGRFVLNTEGRLWKLQHLGLGATYTLGDNFTGVNFGVEMKFKF